MNEQGSSDLKDELFPEQNVEIPKELSLIPELSVKSGTMESMTDALAQKS